jgi:hypothetical protein
MAEQSEDSWDAAHLAGYGPNTAFNVFHYVA